MRRWLDLVGVALQLVGRAYGLIILGIGALLLYWAGRGALAYANGIRAAWADPLACAAGFIGGMLGLWAGARVLRGGIPPGGLGLGRGTSPELDATLAEASRLEAEDPAAARQLLDGYFAREAAMKETRRAELRVRSSDNVEAARALRRELQEEVELNALFRKDVLRKWPEDQRGPMLAEIDQTDRQFRAELLELDDTIARLRLP